jgi:hypothetical protein
MGVYSMPRHEASYLTTMITCNYLEEGRIALVDTEESSLDRLDQLLNTAGLLSPEVISPEVMEEEAMKGHREELEELIDEVYVDMRMNPAEDLRLEDLKDGSSLLMRFNLLDMQIKKCCTMNGRLGRKYPLILNPSVKAELDNKMDQLEERVRAYKRLCMDKRDSFSSAVVSQPGTSGQGDQLAKVMKQKDDGERRVKMFSLYDKLKNICSQLNTDITPPNCSDTLDNVDVWKESEDDDIAKAMVHRERWITRMTQVKDEFSEYKSCVTVWARDDLSRSGSNYLELDDYIEDTKARVDDTIAMVEAEDKRRGLYSLQVAPVSLMEYPKFAGLDSQCFLKFEDKMRRSLKSNKVPLIDQVPKLREYLTGQALNMVPESVKVIDVAFETLRSRYGDEERVLGLKIGDLKKTGSKPEKFRDQVTWYIDLEGKIQQLLDLGSRNDDLGRVAFGHDVFNVILNLFPIRETIKLSKLSGTGKFTKDRLQEFQTTIASFREVANMMDKIRTEPGNQKKDGGGAGLGGGAPKVHYQQQQQRKAAGGGGGGDGGGGVDCRFCKALEKIGGHTGLYENHSGKSYWCCPKFVEMEITARRDVCFKASLCSTCLDMDVVYSSDHGKTCKMKLEYASSGKKPRFMCKGGGARCLWNVWICKKHKLDNQDIMKELSDQM